MNELSQVFWCYDDVFDEKWEWMKKGCDCYEGWWWNERNQELNTFLHISSNEGRECGSSTKQAETSW